MGASARPLVVTSRIAAQSNLASTLEYVTALISTVSPGVTASADSAGDAKGFSSAPEFVSAPLGATKYFRPAGCVAWFPPVWAALTSRRHANRPATSTSNHTTTHDRRSDLCTMDHMVGADAWPDAPLEA